MSIEILREKLHGGNGVNSNGDVISLYDGINGPKTSSGSDMAEVEEFLYPDLMSDIYTGEVPPELMPDGSIEYAVWRAEQNAKIAPPAGRVAIEQPSEDNREMYKPYMRPATPAVHPSRPSGQPRRHPTAAKVSARQSEARARRHRWEN